MNDYKYKWRMFIIEVQLKVSNIVLVSGYILINMCHIKTITCTVISTVEIF